MNLTNAQVNNSIKNKFLNHQGLNLLVLSLFFALSLIGILFHEIWLDEAQHYLLARDSSSLSELLKACRIEGHPLLWNVLLFFITRLSTNVFYMQLAHIIISSITVFIISKSDLRLFEKILVIFGYYIFYEYNIISRNYGLSALLIFMLVHQYKNKRDALVKLSLLLAILANTHLFSLLFTGAFVLTYLIINGSEIRRRQTNKTILLAILLVIVGWFTSIYTLIPPLDYANKFIAFDSSGYLSFIRILKTISVCLKGIFYIPNYTNPYYQFENSFLYLNIKSWILFIVSITAIIIPVIILKKNRFAFILFGTFLLLFFSFYHFLPLVYGTRYFGFFYLGFVACYTIARPQIPKIWIRVSQVILALQFINGIYAYTVDLFHPFSESKEVFEYIKKETKSNKNIFILNRTLRPGICAYSGEKYFGVENGEQLSYCLWNTSMPDTSLKIKLRNALQQKDSAIIISNTGLDLLIDKSKAIRLATFENYILKGEKVIIYRYIK